MNRNMYSKTYAHNLELNKIEENKTSAETTVLRISCRFW